MIGSARKFAAALSPIGIACAAAATLLAAPADAAQAAGEAKGWQEQIQAAQTLADRAEHSQAEALLKAVLADVEHRIDRPAKAIAANAWNDLGTVYLDQGNLDEAERSLRNSIRLHEEVWGRKHAQLAAPIASLGAAMHLRHRFKDAERLYRRSLGILEKTDGRNHAALASVLNHLGSLRIEAGKYAEAEQLLFRGLRIAQENPQASWKERATMHCNLSAVYERLKQFGEAESHARAGLDIWRPHTGEAHPVYALGLVQLAVCVAEQGRLEEAQALGGQAVSTAEGSFGPEHPAFKEILYAYSLVLKASGDKREAKAYRKRAEQLRDAAESDSRRHSVDVSEFAPSDRR